jgi:hypothetical protein
MTDATFRSVKPFTLAILHLVFANETIPIGFSIAPSETGGLYKELYQHIIDLMKERDPQTDEKDNELTRLPVISDMGHIIWAKGCRL